MDFGWLNNWFRKKKYFIKTIMVPIAKKTYNSTQSIGILHKS